MSDVTFDGPRTPMPAVYLGRAIAFCRAEQGLSKTALGERIGMDVGQLSRYERGQRSPQQETLGRIAGGLGVSRSTIYFVAEQLQRVSDEAMRRALRSAKSDRPKPVLRRAS